MRPTIRICIVITALSWSITVQADTSWTGSGSNNLWSNATNWDPGVPQSATDKGVDDINVARNYANGTNILIEDGTSAVAFSVQIGYPIPGSFGDQAASNTLTMTGGTLTTQGNFLMNIGRGRNADVNQLVQFNMSGGVVNAAGITVPEGFNPGSVLGFVSVGINAEMHVSGNAVVNTDILRLGAADAKSVVTISDDARINLTDDNNGFAAGVLWIEAFEDPIVGSSLLDIRDNGQLHIHGEWWTDENGDETRGTATVTEMQYFRDNYIDTGMIVANGGVDEVISEFVNGVIILRAPASNANDDSILDFIPAIISGAKNQ